MGVNVYWSSQFWKFLALFFSRFWGVVTGQLEMMPDELQIFTLMLLGISTTIIGIFLVLRRQTMQANSLSHTTLLGITLVVIFYPFFTAQPASSVLHFSLLKLSIAALITAFLTQFFTRFLQYKMRVQTDASIGLVFSLFFALGVLLVTLYTRNLHVGVEAIMGNVDALHPDDLKLVASILGFNICILVMLYQRYKLTTFDGGLSQSFGLKIECIETLLILQTTITIMAGFRAVGVILILAMMTAPVLIARLFVKRLYALFLLSIAISLFSSLFAVAFSRHILSVTHVATSTSALNILFLMLFFVVSATLVLISKRRRWQWMTKKD